MRARNLSLLLLSLLFAGCENDDPPSDFERRYVLVTIPGFESEDYAALLDHGDPNVRYLAVANLTQAGAFEEIEQTDDGDAGKEQAEMAKAVHALLADEIPKVRAIAAHSPATRLGPEAEANLVALLDDESDTVRVEALNSLASVEELSEAGADSILPALDDENLLVRLHALVALGSRCPELRRNDVTTRLLNAMPDREPLEQLVILKTLAEIGTSEGERLLFSSVTSDKPAFARAALDLISEMEPSPEIETVILAALEKGTPPEEELLSLLTNSATGQSFETARKLLDDERLGFRSRGQSILVKIGTEEARVALLDAYHQLTPEVEKQFSDPDAAEDESAIGEQNAFFGNIMTLSKKLGRLNPEPAAMLQLLSGGGAIEKRMALRWLRDQTVFDLKVLSPDSSGPDFLPEILELAAGDSILLRSEALRTLGHSADPRSAKILAAALDDPAREIREEAFGAALKYATNTADLDLLRKLYARRDDLIPANWSEDDPGMSLRIELEEAIIEWEASWVTRERLHGDLETDQPTATRLIAAFFLGQDEEKRESVAPALIETLDSGSDGEFNFALELAGEFLTREHAARVREIAGSKSDDTQKKQGLQELAEQLSE